MRLSGEHPFGCAADGVGPVNGDLLGRFWPPPDQPRTAAASAPRRRPRPTAAQNQAIHTCRFGFGETCNRSAYLLTPPRPRRRARGRSAFDPSPPVQPSPARAKVISPDASRSTPRSMPVRASVRGWRASRARAGCSRSSSEHEPSATPDGRSDRKRTSRRAGRGDLPLDQLAANIARLLRGLSHGRLRGARDGRHRPLSPLGRARPESGNHAPLVRRAPGARLESWWLSGNDVAASRWGQMGLPKPGEPAPWGGVTEPRSPRRPRVTAPTWRRCAGVAALCRRGGCAGVAAVPACRLRA